MKILYKSTLCVLLSTALFGCSREAVIDPKLQYGADPELPEAKNYLVPPMKVPKGVGWQNDQKPKVVEGLKIEKIADKLMHPRQLYTLPNGDILVVESNGPGIAPVLTPKQLIASKVKGLSRKGGKGGNRITLLRPSANGEWQQHIFLENFSVHDKNR